jgi:sirohydrochlorin cobaltochelatase
MREMPARSNHESSPTAGVLLVGHGTRSKQGQSQFLSLAEQVRQRLNRPLEPAFLELAEPTIEQAVEQLVASRVDRLIVMPLLLFAGGNDMYFLRV